VRAIGGAAEAAGGGGARAVDTYAEHVALAEGFRVRLADDHREWARFDAAVFRTITGDDWKRAIAAARAQPNRAWEQIRKKILDSGLGKCGSGDLRNLTTDNTDKKP
jgi:hypothetical protein